MDGSAPGTRLRHFIIPMAKVTDASNSSKPALKSHKAAADAQRAAEALKAVELKAVQAADAAADTVMPLGLSCYHAPSCTYILSPCVLPDRSYQTITSSSGLTCYLDT